MKDRRAEEGTLTGLSGITCIPKLLGNKENETEAAGLPNWTIDSFIRPFKRILDTRSHSHSSFWVSFFPFSLCPGTHFPSFCFLYVTTFCESPSHSYSHLCVKSYLLPFCTSSLLMQLSIPLGPFTCSRPKPRVHCGSKRSK